MTKPIDMTPPKPEVVDDANPDANQDGDNADAGDD